MISERPFCKIVIDRNLIFLFPFISRDFKQEHVQIRLNLVVALAAAQLAFLSGIYAFEPKVRRQLVIIEYFPFDIKKVLFFCLFFQKKP